MIINKVNGYGNTVRIYYCTSDFLIKKYNGDVPLMYCGSYTQALPNS